MGPDDPLFTTETGRAGGRRGTLTGSLISESLVLGPEDHGPVEPDYVCHVAQGAQRSPRVAQRIMRHAQFAITMEIYTDVIDENMREALRKLGDALT